VNPRLADLLDALLAGGVDFVLVGGLAAVVQAAPVTTFDADVVHERSAANVDRLLAVLATMNARVRDPAGRDLRPARDALLGVGHNLLVTDLGPVDCLGAIEDGRDYAALLPRSLVLQFRGRSLRVLDLAVLVELKERWTDDESRLRAAILRRTLAARGD
jgi:hypothetical protein